MCRQKQLLERINTEDVCDAIVLQFSAFVVSFDPVLITFTKKGGSYALVDKGGIIKVAKYGLLVNFLHRQIVV